MGLHAAGAARLRARWPSVRAARRVCGVVALACAAVLAASRLAAAAAAASLPDMRQVMDHVDDLWRSRSSHTVMTMTVVRPRGTRQLRLEGWSLGKDNMLVVIRSPAREAGTATLRTREGLWNYAPRADRLIRIPTGLLSDSWMGSHFTNDDLMRETSYLDDYDTELSWTDRDGARYLQATLTPKPDAPVVYSRLVWLLDPKDWTPVRAEYYDEGELVRVMSFADVQVVAGRPLPRRMVLVPVSQAEERTVVEYEKVELDTKVDLELFTRRGLRQAARS